MEAGVGSELVLPLDDIVLVLGEARGAVAALNKKIIKTRVKVPE